MESKNNLMLIIARRPGPGEREAAAASVAAERKKIVHNY
jgi:hypothetical protein